MNIKISAKTGHSVALSKLIPFQNDMKVLDAENYMKLRAEIEETGFSFAFHVWESEGKLFILDGHQRLECLKRMMAEEPTDDELHVPVVYVEATNFREAKRKALAGASQYGRFQVEGVMKTLEEAELAPLKAASMFKFPDLDLKVFIPVEPKEVTFKAKEGAKEIPSASFDKFDHQCPRCGFEFDEQKKK